MSDSLHVLRIFVQHYAADMPIRTFLALKQMCSAMADACRAQEPGCHWRRFDQHMSDYTSDWQTIRDYVLASPNVIISYNDELPFCRVTIMNCDMPDSHEVGGTRGGKGHRRILYNVDNTYKWVSVVKDTRYIEQLNSEMRITRDGLRFRSLPKDDADYFENDADYYEYDTKDNAQLNMFIDNVIKYSEHIKSVGVNVERENVVPPYQSLKAALHYGNMNRQDYKVEINIEDFLYFASLDRH